MPDSDLGRRLGFDMTDGSALALAVNVSNKGKKMSDVDQIKALDSGVATGINAGDAAAVVSHYTDNAAIHPPGAGRMDGKEAIEAYWQAGIDGGLSDVSIVATSIDINGNASVSVGTLSGKMGDTALSGKYVVIGMKTDAGWKIHHDIWNFDA